jgi:hypothetical protein
MDGYGQVLSTEVAAATEVRDASLQMVLQETYELFRLLHGTVRARLAQQEVRFRAAPSDHHRMRDGCVHSPFSLADDL